MSVKCRNCGAELRTGFCTNCGFNNATMKFDETYVNHLNKDIPRDDGKKKDSVLSIVSLVITFFSMFGFNFLAIGGVICGIIDLCINDEEKRHIGSIFGVVVGIIILVAYKGFLKNLFF